MKNVVAGLLLMIVVVSGVTGCLATGKQHESDDMLNEALLDKIITARSADDKQRDGYRHPKETLEFFGIQPGMTVVEVLPGGGWYSRILAPYLGESGKLHAVNYADTMWEMFGYMSPEFVAKRKAQMQNWKSHVTAFGGNGSQVMGFTFDAVPDALNGQIDAVLMIRALHNLNRFEARAGTLSQALSDVYRMLKPNGIVGVVQHRSPDTLPDDWAAGQNGYLKTQTVIDSFVAHGFRLVGDSDINANPKDVPTTDDFVWRLPPSLRGPTSNPAALAALKAIGESDRMTLKFIKPE